MDKGNELLSALNEIRKRLGECADPGISDAFGALEGIAPFLDAEMVIKAKCRGCDSYASSLFPNSCDLQTVDNKDYCHARKQPLESIGVLKLAGCSEHSTDTQADLRSIANAILEEDLVPAFAERKLYDRKLFASCEAAFRISQAPGNICIELGHESDDGFMPSDIRIYLLRRLDPGLGVEASQRIAEAMKGETILFVAASRQTRRQMDIDYVLEWIAKKRKMDIVYL